LARWFRFDFALSLVQFVVLLIVVIVVIILVVVVVDVVLEANEQTTNELAHGQRF